MDKRTFVGLCAALAFVAGSPAVHALKIVDAATTVPMATDGTARDSNVYAREMLLSGDANTTESKVEGDTATYYNIGEEDIRLSAPADISANPGDTYLVTYTLDGMVFRTEADIEAPADDFTIATGGQAGDAMVVFRMDNNATAVETTTLIVLNAEFAVSADGNGSVTRTVTNQTLASLNIPGVDGSMTHTASGAIKLGSGIKETAMPMNATAAVEHGFRRFLTTAPEGAAIAHLGSYQVTFNGDVRQATGTNAGDDVDDLTQVINDEQTNNEPNSTVAIMGDFSFASKVYLHGDDDCGVGTAGTDTQEAADETDIRKTEGTGDDEMVVGVNVQDVTAFAAATSLCIMVDPDDEDGMRIPETGAYTVMGDYAKANDDAAFGPESMERMLGRIMRNGTTVRLPYLTTNAKFNQRLYIVNRGPATAYEMDFQMGDTAGEMASGTLEAGRTVMSVSDLVTIGEGGSTSGSLIVEAQPTMIDVATVQVNRELGTTDTVVYD